MVSHQATMASGRSNQLYISTINNVKQIARFAAKGMPKKNTIYCAIKNASNSANWKQIMLALRTVGTPSCLLEILDDYKADKSLICETSKDLKIRIL